MFANCQPLCYNVLVMRLCLNDISVSFGDKEVLKNINFEVNTKDKIAIIGRNGSGKTTLLRVITGKQEIDSSYNRTTADKIQKTGKFEIGYLKQIAFENDNELFEDEILKIFKPITDLKEKIEHIETDMANGKPYNINKYEELINQYDLMGGYTYLKEYNVAIKKFGFTEADKTKKLNEFSGGQRTKIALLKLLLSKPDLLILDEPTNHLDITAIKWLEDFLSNYSKAIIVVSHDRAFLDKFVNIVYEIERNEIKKYIGNYTDFANKKILDYEKQLKEYTAYTKEKDRLPAVADRFRYKATKASMAQSKLKQIDKMSVVENPMEADNKSFFTKTQPRVESGNDVMFADNITIGYDKPLTSISFKVIKKDRIAVIGGNGLGKSTLLKSIVDKIPLLGGKIKFGTNVEIGYFDQQTATNNINNETVIESFLREFPEEDTQSARTILGSFMFTQDDVFKNLKSLSGGELVRLELCKILRRRPNFLILDEPTNHLDIVGKEALEKMLLGYDGTILFVSHDRYFVNKIASHLIVFENGCGKFLKNTTYKEYEEQQNKIALDTTTNTTAKSNINNKDIPTTKKDKPNQYLINKEKAKNEAKKKKLEKQIADIEDEIQKLKQSLEDPEICSNYVKIMEIQKNIDEKNIELENIMETWLNLCE